MPFNLSENRENNTYSNNILNVDLQVVAKADLRVEGYVLVAMKSMYSRLSN